MRNRGRNQAPRRVPPPRARPELIRELNENDVLLGRGLGPSQYIGNRRLRDLGLSLKEEYNGSKSYKVKKMIGRKMYDEILGRGGRFLQQVSKWTAGRDALYEEVDRKKGEEKCKQLLREKPSDKEEQTPETSSIMNMQDVAEEEDLDDNGDDNVADISPPHVELPESPPADVGEVEIIFEGIHFPELTSSQEPSGGGQRCQQSLRDNSSDKEQQGLETSSLEGVAGEDFVDNHDGNVAGFSPPHVELAIDAGGDEIIFEGIRFPESSPSAEDLPPPISPSLTFLLPPTISENLSPIDTRTRRDTLDRQAPNVGSRDDRATLKRTDLIDTFEKVKQEQAHSLDDDVAVSFLSALGLGLHQPRFSQQDQVQERATLTEEERRSILLDVFGDKSSLTDHQRKRRQSDKNGDSISFLVKQMRTAVDMMKASKKEALLEALVKASPEEFSDSRLEQFLRSDGMNPELAALRFVKYWTSRRKLFGEEKYTKRMILSEAFCDDIPALKQGVFTLLPKRDSSGRHLMYIDGARLSDAEYDPESMVRAFWYLVEIVLREGGSGFVVLDMLKDASLFDFDYHVFLPIIKFSNDCWPIKPVPGHTCCPPKILLWLFTPIAFAMQGKEMRTRNTMHDVIPAKLADSLSPFGITKDMLPMHMGGTIQLNPSDWIAERRAIEMEEIV